MTEKKKPRRAETRPQRAKRWSALAAAAVALATSAAAAQTIRPQAGPAVGSASELRREQDGLFDQVLRDPANLDLTLRYARVSTELGDYEAAITALERILFFNPSLSRARLELGVLYYRLGSYGLARSYLEQAKSGGVPPETAALVDRYLADIAKRESPHQFSGTVAAGILRESNANLGPASPDVRVAAFPGGIGTLSPQFVKKADESLFTTGSALYSYDLQDQDRTTLEATGQAYISRHFRVRDFDLVYLEGTFGPRTTLASYGLTGFTTRPYLIADYVRLGGDPLFHAFGAGLEAAQAILPDLVLKGVYELREKRYYDTRDRVTAPDLSGLDNGVSLQLSYALTPDQLVTGTLSFLDEDARADYETNRQYGVGLAYQIAYAAPFGWNAAVGSWQTALSGGRTIYNYAAPNPVIDPTTERFDRRWRFTIGQLVPLAAGTALNLQLQRDIVSSSIPNFAYTNTSVVVGLQLRF